MAANRPIGWSRDVKIVRLSKKEREKPKATRKDWKLWLLRESGAKCASCGYSRSWATLHFHHLERTEKSASVTDLLSRWFLARSDASKQKWWDRMQAEIKKCVLLCANCHITVTHPGWGNLKEQNAERYLRGVRVTLWYRRWVATHPKEIQRLLKDLWRAAHLTNIAPESWRMSGKLRRLRPDLGREFDKQGVG